MYDIGKMYANAIKMFNYDLNTHLKSFKIYFYAKI